MFFSNPIFSSGANIHLVEGHSRESILKKKMSFSVKILLLFARWLILFDIGQNIFEILLHQMDWA